jgi:hypothetical protein
MQIEIGGVTIESKPSLYFYMLRDDQMGHIGGYHLRQVDLENLVPLDLANARTAVDYVMTTVTMALNSEGNEELFPSIVSKRQDLIETRRVFRGLQLKLNE